MSDTEDLEKRVQQFNSLSLPGQPMSMHMGTSYLVNDLWREVQRLRAAQQSSQGVSPAVVCEKCGHLAKYPVCTKCGNAIPLPPNY